MSRRSDASTYIVEGCPLCDGWHRDQPCPYEADGEDGAIVDSPPPVGADTKPTAQQPSRGRNEA